MGTLASHIERLLVRADGAATCELAEIHYEVMQNDEDTERLRAECAALRMRADAAELAVVRVAAAIGVVECGPLDTGFVVMEAKRLLARAEEAERKRDEIHEDRRRWLLGYIAFEDAFRFVLGDEGVEGNVPPTWARELLTKLRRERDARLSITPEDAAIAACRLILEQPDGPSAREADARSVALNVLFALREHAKGAKS